MGGPLFCICITPIDASCSGLLLRPLCVGSTHLLPRVRAVCADFSVQPERRLTRHSAPPLYARSHSNAPGSEHDIAAFANLIKLVRFSLLPASSPARWRPGLLAGSSGLAVPDANARRRDVMCRRATPAQRTTPRWLRNWRGCSSLRRATKATPYRNAPFLFHSFHFISNSFGHFRRALHDTHVGVHSHGWGSPG